MASGREEEVIESMRALTARVAELPPPQTEPFRAALERLDRALRAAGYELGRPAWMKP
jgi:hypothetical protein